MVQQRKHIVKSRLKEENDNQMQKDHSIKPGAIQWPKKHPRKSRIKLSQLSKSPVSCQKASHWRLDTFSSNRKGITGWLPPLPFRLGGLRVEVRASTMHVAQCSTIWATAQPAVILISPQKKKWAAQKLSEEITVCEELPKEVNMNYSVCR